MSTTFRRARSGLYVPHGGGGGPTYAATVLADAPLAWYRLGETFTPVFAAASSTNFVSEPPGNAFDGDPTSNWTTSSGNTTGWLRAQMNAPVALTSYMIRRRDDLPTRNPKTWTFEGSNDASSWTTLDTRTNITWPTAGETKTFTFSNSTTYAYYRLNVSANSGDASFLSVTELRLLPNAADSSGNSRDGYYQGTTLTSGTTGLVTGDSDKAVTFSGGFVRIPFASWMNLSTLAIEALINPSSIGAYMEIADRDPGSSTRIFQFRVNPSGKLEFLLWTGAGILTTVTGATTLAAGTKYDVGCSYDGTTARVLVNGVSDGSAAVSGALVGSTGTGSLPILLGVSSSNLTSFPFLGVMDEVSIYASLTTTRFAAHAALV